MTPCCGNKCRRVPYFVLENYSVPGEPKPHARLHRHSHLGPLLVWHLSHLDVMPVPSSTMGSCLCQPESSAKDFFLSSYLRKSSEILPVKMHQFYEVFDKAVKWALNIGKPKVLLVGNCSSVLHSRIQLPTASSPVSLYLCCGIWLNIWSALFLMSKRFQHSQISAF